MFIFIISDGGVETHWAKIYKNCVTFGAEETLIWYIDWRLVTNEIVYLKQFDSKQASLNFVRLDCAPVRDSFHIFVASVSDATCNPQTTIINFLQLQSQPANIYHRCQRPRNLRNGKYFMCGWQPNSLTQATTRVA